MDRLGARDLRTVLEVAGELGAVRDPGEFNANLLAQLHRLVPFDLASCNEISLSTGQAVVTASTPVIDIPSGDEEILGTYAQQNPLIAAADPRLVLKFSDFLSPRQLHRLDLYDLIYQRLRVEHQIAFLLASPMPRVVGVALSRVRRDFSERDRSVLEAIRPLATRAYRDVIQRAITGSLLAALDTTGADAASAVIVLDRSGRIAFATGPAKALLGAWPDGNGNDRLPAEMAAWYAAQRSQNGDGESTRRTLRLRIDQSVLEARILPGPDHALDAIVLRHQRELAPSALRELGLTAREAQVLELVAHGQSNTRIAFELGLSHRTVAKHLEHIYTKLGETGRMAAVSRARRVSDSLPGGL
jgi:DNA-binding CsgD family transcriptional regulator